MAATNKGALNRQADKRLIFIWHSHVVNLGCDPMAQPPVKKSRVSLIAQIVPMIFANHSNILLLSSVGNKMMGAGFSIAIS